VSILKRWGAKRIVIIAAIGSRQGVDRLQELHPTVDIYIAAIDEHMDDKGYIIPGIGDAGNRQFGTLEEIIPQFLPTDPLTPTLTKRTSSSD
jgi:uracil phosphoribosyltransferase